MSMRGVLHRFKLHVGDSEEPEGGMPALLPRRGGQAQRLMSAIIGIEEMENDTRDGKTFEQAGGHLGSFHSLENESGYLVKRVAGRERDFYEDTWVKGKPVWPRWAIPKYFGRRGDSHILLEDLTFGMKKPCVMDLKMGQTSVEVGESLKKRARMTALDLLTGTRSTGVRLEGMSMYRVLEGKRIRGSKKQAHMISASLGASLEDVLTFFLTDESGVRTDLALRFQVFIEMLKEHFEHQNDKFKFIGSSLLFVYDNDNLSPHMRWARALKNLPGSALKEDDVVALTRRTKMAVRMIDFAHVQKLDEDQTRDEGYIHGLETILCALRAIRRSCKKPVFSCRAVVEDVIGSHKASNMRRDSSSSCFNFNSLLSRTSSSLSVKEDATAQLKATDSRSSGSEASKQHST